MRNVAVTLWAVAVLVGVHPLDLSQNNIHKPPHENFQNLTDQRHLLFIQNLRVLDLTFNLFHTINLGVEFCSLGKLESLGLGANIITVEDFINIPDVHLQTLTLCLENFTAYESGSLGDIQAEKVRIDLMNKPTDRDLIEEVVTFFFSLEALCNFFISMPVEHLAMTETSIIHMTCPKLPSGILQLDFSECTLTDTVFSRVELQIAHMSSLRHLDLSLNSLVYSGQECHWLECHWLELVFSCLPNSTPTLDLQNNQISNVPEALLALDSLLALYLSTNRLRKLPGVRWTPTLKYLLLRENSLHAPSVSGLAACPVLRVLDASRNPFTCTLRGFRDLGTSGTGLGTVTVIIVMATLCHHLDVPWYLGIIWQWTQVKHHSRTQQVRPQNVEGVLFHALVSYSQHNADWVKGSGVKYLRKNTLKIHLSSLRDFVPGKTIVENIIQCVERSRRCVFILSGHLVRSESCGSGAAVLWVMMGRHTYLEWPQDRGKHRLFWANLRAALQCLRQEAQKVSNILPS
uniref:Toll-like receptor 1 n=1 Tax=Salmo trutta TaxID=8032 RepID=A0A674DNB9_SALTR